MKSIKRAVRNSKEKLETSVGKAVSPHIGRLSNRYRLRARIRLINSKAARQPKKWMLSFIALFAFILISNIVGTLLMTSREKSSDNSNFFADDIVKVDTLFEGFRMIQAYKDEQRKEIGNLATTGMSLKNELDSLMAIPNKTKEDSLQLISKARQAKILVERLNSNYNDKPN